MSKKDILIIGYGNPGRLDDGLGPAFADAIEKLELNNVKITSNYQLSVEDAVDISKHKIIIFADADSNGREPFYFKKITASKYESFTSHSITPEALMGLVKKIFGIETTAYLLGIRGYQFNKFGEKLSRKAKNNLSQAIGFIKTCLENKHFPEVK